MSDDYGYEIEQMVELLKEIRDLLAELVEREPDA